MDRDAETRLLIWDFDGTLGYRHGGAWSAALLEVLRRQLPGIEATDNHFRPYLQTGFPWHHPERPHPGIEATVDHFRPYLQTGLPWHHPERPHAEIETAETRWARLGPLFQRAFQAVGRDVGATVGPSLARSLAEQVRPTYTDPARWRLFEDTLPTLDRLSERGWTHVLLSNHVPELREILDHLGLTPRMARIFNSAETGYEKPHPRAFEMVLESFPDPAAVWMVGDNPQADVAGAEAVGIPAILVRRTGAGRLDVEGWGLSGAG